MGHIERSQDCLVYIVYLHSHVAHLRFQCGPKGLFFRHLFGRHQAVPDTENVMCFCLACMKETVDVNHPVVGFAGYVIQSGYIYVQGLHIHLCMSLCSCH